MHSSNADIVLLDPDRHQGLGLRADLDFGFARNAALVPIYLSEIAAASVWYPVVFSQTDDQPLVVLGPVEHGNCFITENGGWRANAYVPAAIRRYPFVLAAQPDGEARLAVQSPADVLVPGGRALYADGAPTPLHESALDFCRNLVAEERETRAFVAALRSHDLLCGRVANYHLGAGRTLQQGFLTLDERRFRGLSDELFLQLRRRGWLAPLFAQLNSLLNWHKISDLAAAQAALSPIMAADEPRTASK